MEGTNEGFDDLTRKQANVMLLEKLKRYYLVELSLVLRNDGSVRGGLSDGNIRDINEEACS